MEGNKRGTASASPTLDEVAKLAGVSRATASRAINGGHRVSVPAQASVEAAVKQLRFVPNPAARRLVTRRTDSVAVVVPDPDDRVFSDPFFARTLRGVTRVLGERDIQLVLLLARPGASTARTLRYLTNRRADGALVVNHHRDDGLADELTRVDLPCVFSGRPWSGSERVAYVDVDNTAGEREATELLIHRGCRRIGTIAGPSSSTAAQDRLAGWRQAMSAAGLSDEAVTRGDFTEDSGQRAAQVLLAVYPDLDGIVVASDLMASGALKVLASLGRRVPDDVAVTGYDDLGTAARTSPPLTTVRQPVEEMAERATRLLLEQVDGTGDRHPMRVILRPQLVRRGSA